MENLHSAAEAETPLSPSDAMSDGETPTARHDGALEHVATEADDSACTPAESSGVGADAIAEVEDDGAEAAAPKAKVLHPRAVLNILADRYPAAFHADGRLVRPLAVGVLQELRAAREGDNPLPLTTQDLRRALRYYTQGAAYHRAVARGDARINLLGEAVAEVTEEQKQHATAKLAELEPKLPKRPERAPRPARTAPAAQDGSEPTEADASTQDTQKESRQEQARRPRNPMDKRPAGRAPRREGGERRESNRESRPARPVNAPKPAVAAEQAAAAESVPMDINDKLSLLVAKFGRS